MSAIAPIAIPLDTSFADMVQIKGKADIGDQINKKVLRLLVHANNLSDKPSWNDPNRSGCVKEPAEIRGTETQDASMKKRSHSGPGWPRHR